MISAHPDARITIACGVPAAPLFRSTPRVERIIALEKKPLAGHWISLWLQTVPQGWDMVVDLRASALAWLLKTKRRYVFRSQGSDIHRVVQLAAMMLLEPPPAPLIHLAEEERTQARGLIPDGGPVLAIGPTANWIGKQWPGERFTQVISRLTEPGGVLEDARVAVFGTSDERKMAETVLKAVPQDRLIDLVGEVDILTAGACLERCALFIGNDSGLMHLAGAVGSPVVGLFGPSREALYAPWGETGIAVRGPLSYEDIASTPGFDLAGPVTYMSDLDPNTVLSAAEDLLHRSGRRQPAAAAEGTA